VVERALRFGSVAAAYERFRQGYPDRLVVAVLEYAGRPIRTALEVGAGTGKATRVFAAHGIDVTATDPDEGMLAELRRHVPDGVRTVRCRFEELPLTTSYDLVFAAASFHWTRPEGRWERVAALLDPGGVFASFGGAPHLADPAVDEAFRRARSPYVTDDDVRSPDGTSREDPMQWPGTELERSNLFTDVRQLVIERRAMLSAEEYVGHLSTVSAYLMLDQADREVVLARILDALPERVAITADLTVHLARLAAGVSVTSGTTSP
jgi:SAM-dependent methyltransferase